MTEQDPRIQQDVIVKAELAGSQNAGLRAFGIAGPYRMGGRFDPGILTGTVTCEGRTDGCGQYLSCDPDEGCVKAVCTREDCDGTAMMRQNVGQVLRNVDEVTRAYAEFANTELGQE